MTSLARNGWAVTLVVAIGCFNPDESSLDTDAATEASGPDGSTTDAPTGPTTESPTTGSTTSPDTTDPTDTTTTQATGSETGDGSGTGAPGVCGDGSQDAGEECDDGDLEAGDGCSAACLDENDRCEPGLIGGFNINLVGPMVVRGGYVYLLQHGNQPMLRILDATDPANIMSLGSWAPDPNDYPNFAPGGLAFKDDHVAISGNGPELVTIDVSDPQNPTLAYLGGPNVADGSVHIEGDVMYQAYSVAETARVWNVTNMATPTHSYPSVGNPNQVFTHVTGFGDYAIIAAHEHVEVWDTSIPAAPVFVGELDLPVGGPTNSVHANADTIAFVHPNTVRLIDYSLPSVPEVVGSIDIFIGGFAVRGDFAYGGIENGLRVWDISSPASPTVAGNYVQVEAFSGSVALGDELVYLYTEAGLRVLEEMPGMCESQCGNNHVEYPEDCDDGNHDDGDGCSATCIDG